MKLTETEIELLQDRICFYGINRCAENIGITKNTLLNILSFAGQQYNRKSTKIKIQIWLRLPIFAKLIWDEKMETETRYIFEITGTDEILKQEFATRKEAMNFAKELIKERKKPVRFYPFQKEEDAIQIKPKP